MLAPWGFPVTHAWHADLNLARACLRLHALYTAVTTHVCLHVCSHPDPPMFSVCEHPGPAPA